MKTIKRVSVFAFALIMTLVLVACGGNADEAADSSSEGSGELAGKPWVTSILQGNLPPEQPELKDDMFTHYDYDYLADHQMMPTINLVEHASELKSASLKTIKDDSKSSHDLDQLRLFFDQASDTKTLKETGLADIQPYLDRIDAVTSIDEMNELLTADDFPFSPFALAYLSLNDTRGVNIVAVNPNLALVDPVMVGGTYYQDTDDPQEQETIMAALANSSGQALFDLSQLGMDEEEVKAAFDTMLGFEQAHGKYADYNGKYSMEDFGVMADVTSKSYFTIDELCDACPNFPMKATLEKLGKATSPTYFSVRDWLEALNSLWTDENIEAIKLITKTQVLNETRPYRDHSGWNKALEEAGQPATDSESYAFDACNQQSTFAIVLAESYNKDVLGEEAKERLTKLSQDLVDTYKDLVDRTPWMGEKSKKNVIEKLDNMTLNILEPTGGYYDFSGLELTPTEDGGTLVSNYLELKQYRLDQESKMVGQPAVPASAWFTIRPTEVNAFYDPQSNSINIYPGYMTSLVYTKDMSDLDLLSGIGFTIGHEISHGFDYQGAQFDAYGTPNPLFADADVDAFVVKTSALASYYKGLEIAPKTMVNGENVVTEAAADLSGLQAALELASKEENVDYNQFFSRFANVWAEVVPAQALPTLVLDTHPMNNHRVNVNAQMFDPIYDELGVSEGDGMYLPPQERINIWGENS